MGFKEIAQALNRRKLRKQEEELKPTSVLVEEVSTEMAEVISSYNGVMNAGIAYADTIMELKAELREKAAASATTTLEARVPAGTTVINAGGVTVYDATGKPRMRMGVFTDEDAQAIPAYNESTQEVQEQMVDFNNADILKQRLIRDKAIIAMHILRVTKPKGDKGKGIGPNREDHPLFREVVHMWMQGVEITGENLVKVEQARERVTKYNKQLVASIYAGPIDNQDFKRGEMLESVQHAYTKQAEAELAEALREEIYGDW